MRRVRDLRLHDCRLLAPSALDVLSRALIDVSFSYTHKICTISYAATSSCQFDSYVAPAVVCAVFVSREATSWLELNFALEEFIRRRLGVKAT